MQNLKIFIDTSPLKTGHAMRGIGSYTRQLVEAFKNKKSVTVVENINESDVVHYPYFDLFYPTFHIEKLKPTIVTIHDVIPLIYPKQYPPGLRGTLNFIRQKNSLKKVTAIITDSETSKKDIVRFLNVPQEKINVIHLAQAEAFKPVIKNVKQKIKKKYNLPDRFVMYTGDINYNKNTINLIKACQSIEIPLVICGKQAQEIEDNPIIPFLNGPQDWARYISGKSHPEHIHFESLLEAFKNKNVIRLGFVPEEDLVAIYNLASVYCQPSFYEGFGLPVLEAMASGCPVVAGKTQALVEIAFDAVIFADPYDYQDFAKHIANLLKNGDISDQLRQKGFKRSKQFSWEKTSQKTVRVYEKAVGSYQ